MLIIFTMIKECREGTLKSPSEKLIMDGDDADENHNGDYEKELIYQDMILRNAKEIMLKIDFEIYNEMWFPRVTVEGFSY